MPDTFPELAGKAAIVTGASRGIGAAAARELARHGVAVVLAARTLEASEMIAAEIRQTGGRAVAVACDVSHYDDVAAAVRACQDEFGRLDILVSNAGVVEPIARLADSDPEAWAHAADINFKGVYFGLRAALPVMLDQKAGVVINISSGAATGALEGWSHYCASKAAALSLTRCADKEYREQGIRVMGLSPGTVATEMQVLIKASGINPVSQLDPAVHILPEIPARAIAWMCTEAAADYCGTDLSLRDEKACRRIGLDY
ncbi:MAG: SDR family oxidoreductase [Paracoccaceae bacterium]|nr:SDR family oxidoreductase [Paracoccaceae bacterium]